MKLVLMGCALFMLSGCTAKKKWDKDTLVNDCLRQFTEKNEKEKLLSTMQLANICDCLADKMLVKYKSGAEADKDEAGAEQMGRECALQVMGDGRN